MLGAARLTTAALSAPLQPLYSPGSAAGTPQLFTQRKSLFGSVDATAPAAAAAPAVGNDDCIKVVARIRPPAPREAGEAPCLQHTAADTLTLLSQPEAAHYSLDHVAGASSTQQQLYKVVGRPIVDNVLSGYNACLIAYGQTGSGKVGEGQGQQRMRKPRLPPAHPLTRANKPSTHPCLQTHTMLGELPGAGQEGLPEGAGLIPRAFEHLFSRIAQLEGAPRPGRQISFSVSVALLEIYTEQVRGGVAASTQAGGQAGHCGGWQRARPSLQPSASLRPALAHTPDHRPPGQGGAGSGAA